MIFNIIILVKFKYSEKATKFSEISTVDLSYVVTVKPTVEISQNFVAFSEYMNFRVLLFIFRGQNLTLAEVSCFMVRIVSAIWADSNILKKLKSTFGTFFYFSDQIELSIIQNTSKILTRKAAAFS